MTAQPSSAHIHQSFEHQTAYQSLVDVQFVSKALAEGARCVRGARWATETLYPADHPALITSAYYNYNRSFEALARVGEALAHVIRQEDTVTVRLAAASQAALDRAEAELREQLPEPEREGSPSVGLEFSYFTPAGGPIVTTRTLEVPTLADVEGNYPGEVRRALRGMVDHFHPGDGGRLLLWHGPPGCGKTWALRALAHEWRGWCTVRYVTDPERLVAEPAYLVDVMHMRPRPGTTPGGWWCSRTPASCSAPTPRSRPDRDCPACSTWSTACSARAVGRCSS